jgi:DNA-binding CsgD family transcriptional regulator
MQYGMESYEFITEIMALSAYSYKEYLEMVSGDCLSDIKNKSSLIISRFQRHSNISTYTSPITFLVDYSTKKYVYMGENCLSMIGRPAEHYYEIGIKGFWEQTDPSDFSIINQEVFPYNINFIRNIPLNKYPDYVFSHNFRMYKPSGEVVMLLQRSSFVAGQKQGVPAGVIGVVFDITHYKNDTTIVHTIEKTGIVDYKIVFNLLYKATLPVKRNVDRFELSKREIAILKMISKGYSSKQIAAEFQISINTVNNHRKRILKKTNCKSFNALLKIAIQYDLI